MGRNSVIPSTFAQQTIKFRIPYTMAGEKTSEANSSGNQFADATFIVNIDKPFEIERMYVRLTSLDDQNLIVVPTQTDLKKRVRITLQDLSKNQDMTKAVQLVDTLISSEQGSAGSWEWYSPYTMVRAEGFVVAYDVLALVAPATKVRVEVSFQGSLIVIQPASETR